MSQNKNENIKVEKNAIWELEGVINNSEYLDHSFKSMDKELSWDGYIYVYNNTKFSNHTLEDKIPVQIKGKIDTMSIEKNRKNIQHAVDLDVLKNYYNDRGVIFFKIILTNNNGDVPSEGMQYWVAPFVDDYLIEHKGAIDVQCIEYLKKITGMQFTC